LIDKTDEDEPMQHPTEYSDKTIEPLEPRRLLSSTLLTGMLSVVGPDRNDAINV